MRLKQKSDLLTVEIRGVKVLLMDKLTFQIVPKTTSALLLVTIGKGKPT